MNPSKARDPRSWRKWYQSGAVRQVRLDPIDLVVTATGTTYKANRPYNQTLSLGDRVVNSGPGWSVAAPVCTVVVPGDKYRPGDVLERIPGNAVPTDIFYFYAHLK